MLPSPEKDAATKKWFEEGEFEEWLVKLENSLPAGVSLLIMIVAVNHDVQILEEFNISLLLKLYIIVTFVAIGE